MADKRVRQTRNEIEGHLREQVGFVLASIQRFDEGEVAEAKRLATHIRTMLHDGRGQSLVTQLGLKRKLLFYDAVDMNDPSIKWGIGPVAVSMWTGPSGPRCAWAPLLDRGTATNAVSRRRWHHWWSRVVMKDAPTTGFSRENIVLWVAQQDGGAHVDPALEVRYADLSRRNAMGCIANTGNGPQPMPHIELMCVRHIAHELLVTLACQVDWSFEDNDARLRYVRELLTFDAATGRMKCVGRRPPFDQLPHM